jgi:hypothetical protein
MKYRNSMKPSAVLESNMAASKPEKLVFSQSVHNNCCIVTCMASRIEQSLAIPTFLSTHFTRELLSMLFDVLGAMKSKMAAAKPEVLVSRLPDELLNKAV